MKTLIYSIYNTWTQHKASGHTAGKYILISPLHSNLNKRLCVTVNFRRIHQYPKADTKTKIQNSFCYTESKFSYVSNRCRCKTPLIGRTMWRHYRYWLQRLVRCCHTLRLFIVWVGVFLWLNSATQGRSRWTLVLLRRLTKLHRHHS